MRKVILLRHAKSSWNDPQLDDHDRPLNSRGEAAAPIIGGWLAHKHLKPDVVLCSSSVRTCQTVARMRASMPGLPEPLVEEGLYHASPTAMRERLNRLPEHLKIVLLVGHQPGLGSLVRQLSDGTERRRCRRAYEHFPTAAAAVLEADLDDWSELRPGSARFVDFAKPRELIDANV